MADYKAFADILEDNLFAKAGKANVSIETYIEQNADMFDDEIMVSAEERKEINNGVEQSVLGYLADKAGVSVFGAKSSVISDLENRDEAAAAVLLPVLAEAVYNDTIYTAAGNNTIFTTDNSLLMPVIPRGSIETNDPEWDENFLRASDLVTLRSNTETREYKGLEVSMLDIDGLPRVNEGMDLPLVKMGSSENSVKFDKYGMAVELTYEDRQLKTFNEVAYIFREIAKQDEFRRLKEIVKVAVIGDGNANPANARTTGVAAWALGDFRKWVKKVGRVGGTNINLAFANVDEILAIQELAEPRANYVMTKGQKDMEASAVDILPNGIRLKSVRDGTILDGMKSVFGLNTRSGLQELTRSNSTIREVQKEIRNQTWLFTYSTTLGYRKPVPAAFEKLTASV